MHFGTAVHTWGTGVAGLVHDLTLDQLRDEGHRRAWLKVLTDNTRAIRFYTRRGWHDTGSTGHSEFPPYPVVNHLERDLTDGSNLR